MSTFADRVVLITGAGNGIGRQLAHLFAAEGARVAALDCQAKSLDHLAEELAGKAMATACADVTDLAGLRTAVGRLESQLGPTDLLIANAGVGFETSAISFRAEEISTHVQVNLLGVANSVDAVLPGMLKRRQGHLAVLSSLASYRGLPRMAAYCASKAGVNALFDSLRVELASFGIAVTTLCPGWVRTGLTANVGVPKHEMLDVTEAARRMLDALRARKAFCAFPSVDKWRVRLLRHVPLPLSDWLTRRALLRFAKK